MHDYQGDSRGTACAIAYLIKFHNHRFDSALKIVLEGKKKAGINRMYREK